MCISKEIKHMIHFILCLQMLSELMTTIPELE